MIFKNIHDKSYLPKVFIAIAIANIMPWIFPYIVYKSGGFADSIGMIEFVVILIPLKENYLKEKYGDEYLNYAAQTKMLIPHIF